MQPSATALVQQAFSTQPVVYEEDAYGNLENADSSKVVTAAIESGAGSLLGTTSVTVSGGVATFTGLADNTAESITLLFTSGSLTPAVSGTVVVNPAVALAVNSFTSTPGPVQIGGDVTYTIVVSNSGPSPATGVTVTSPLATGASYVAGSGSVSTSGSIMLQGSSVVVIVPMLAQGASATVRFTVSPDLVGTLTGVVSVTANETNLNTSNNSARVPTTVVDRVGTIEFSAAGTTVAENAGSAAITVNRVDGARGSVTVDYTTVPINATPGLDYTPVSGTLTFPNGVTSQTIVVPVLDNPYDDHNELVSVVLSNVQTTETLGQPILGSPRTASLTIVDIDPDTSPLAVSNVRWTGSAQGISQIFVTFTQPLIASTAMNPANYALVNTAPVGKGGTLADTAMPMGVTMSPSSSSVVVLTPAQPLPINRFFRLELNADAGGLEDLGDNMLAGDGSTPGTAYTAMLARGTSLKYSTPAGDQVSLKITGGGYLDDLLSGSGQGVRLTVVGEVPHHTVLSGSVRKARGGTGQAYLGSTIWGLGNFGDVRVKLQSPPFHVGQYPFSPNSAASAAATPSIALSSAGGTQARSTAAKPMAMNRPFRRFSPLKREHGHSSHPGTSQCKPSRKRGSSQNRVGRFQPSRCRNPFVFQDQSPLQHRAYGHRDEEYFRLKILTCMLPGL